MGNKKNRNKKHASLLIPNPLADAFLEGDESDAAAVAFMEQQNESMSVMAREFFPMRGRGAIVGPYFYSAQEMEGTGFSPRPRTPHGHAYQASYQFAYLSRAQLLGEQPLRSGGTFTVHPEARASILEIIDTYNPDKSYIWVLHDRAGKLVGIFGRALASQSPIQ